MNGVVRKMRATKATDGEASGKKRKGWCYMNGISWKADALFDIERLLDKKVERRQVGKVTSSLICMRPRRKLRRLWRRRQRLKTMRTTWRMSEAPAATAQ